MLRDLRDLEGFAIEAIDGPIGAVKDYYFDDERWVVRYLVVETGSWLYSRRVLLSPISLGPAQWGPRRFSVAMSRERVRNSPDLSLDQPVSRQHETLYGDYYGYAYYWGGPGLWGSDLYPGMAGGAMEGAPYHPALEAERAYRQDYELRHRHDDHHLRSLEEVRGYHIKASDGEIGHLHGLLVDDRSWAIRYLVVDTSNWWLGHLVLIAPQWVREVDWSAARMHTDLTQDQIRHAPIFDPTLAPDRALEVALHQHYGRPGYWLDDATEAVATHPAAESPT